MKEAAERRRGQDDVIGEAPIPPVGEAARVYGILIKTANWLKTANWRASWDWCLGLLFQAKFDGHQGHCRRPGLI